MAVMKHERTMKSDNEALGFEYRVQQLLFPFCGTIVHLKYIIKALRLATVGERQS